MTGKPSTGGLIGLMFGSYKIVGRLGQGGMASVYRGYQEAIDRTVAIKILPAELLHDPSFFQRFTNEARTLAHLQHPNILPMYDYGEANGIPYIMMPLMSGGTLADRIRQGRFAPAEAAELLGPIADALDYAHSQGLLHRDIKPNNILFDPNGRPMLADFGIAKSTESASGLTGTGIIGTPDFMSPEQARGEQLDRRSDVYALAVVVYQMLTGRPVFEAGDPMGVLLKHVTEQPRTVRQFRPDLSPQVETVVMKSLAKNPGARHQSAGDFIRELAAVASPNYQTRPQPLTLGPLADAPAPGGGTSPALSPATGVQPAARANTWLLAGGAALLIGVCVLGFFGLAGLGVFGVGMSSATSQAATAQVVAATQAAESAAATEAAAVAQATRQAEATAVALAQAEPINRGATWPLALADDFSGSSDLWPVGALSETRVSGTRYITGGAYLWSLLSSESVNLRTDLDFDGGSGDFYLAVDGRQVSGPDGADYGLVFRRLSSRSFYYFAISESGTYALYLLQGGAWSEVIGLTRTDAIVPGSQNRLTVVGEGAGFTMYINGVRVAEADNDRLASGGFGLAAQLNANQRGRFEFDNFELRQP